MRKLFVFLLILLFASPCQALMLPHLCGKAGPAPDHCSACTVADADVSCTDFEDASVAPCVTCGVAPCWTVNDDGDGSVTFEAHPAALTDCTDEGSYALKIVHADESDVDQFAEYNIGSVKDAIYIQGWLYVDAVTLSDGELFQIVSTNETTEATQGLRLFFRFNDPNYRLYATYWEDIVPDPDTYTGTATGTTNLALQTWYRIRIYFEGGVDVKVWVNDTLDIDVADCGGPGYGTQYVYFGSYLDAEEAHTVYWDNIKIDDDTMPGDCL